MAITKGGLIMPLITTEKQFESDIAAALLSFY